MAGNPDYAVQMCGITKAFGPVNVLENINLDVRKGTVHALLGENGAGKTTLMNILYGLYKEDTGGFYINGQKVDIKTPGMAIAMGIGMVHQHFMLVDNFTVTHNIMLGSEIVSRFGLLDTKKARAKIMEIVKRYGLEVDPDANVEDISVGMQQRVEILKALYRGAQLLILDEPTAVLTPQETKELIAIMHKLVEDGRTVIIITHKLKEIKAAADFCTIIRRGCCIDTVKVSETTETQLAESMVGRSVKLAVDKTQAQPGEVVFEIKNLIVENERGMQAVKELTLKVRRGEIYGIAGVDGNGQKELVEAITSLVRAKSGTIKVNGREIQNTKAANVIKNKVATIHEDRQKRGLVLDFSVAENAVLERYNREPYSKCGILNSKEIKRFANKLVCDYDVRPGKCEDLKVRELSGGNQQKVIIGREIANEPDLLVAVQPTRGLDVGAIEYVHKTLVAERDKGRAILLISLELDEIMSVADTIGVIYDGTIVKELSQGQADENTIGLLMAGGKGKCD